MALAGDFGDNYKTVLWKRKDAMTGFFQEVSDYCGVTEVTAIYMNTRYVCGYLGYLGKISYCVCDHPHHLCANFEHRAQAVYKHLKVSRDPHVRKRFQDQTVHRGKKIHSLIVVDDVSRIGGIDE